MPRLPAHDPCLTAFAWEPHSVTRSDRFQRGRTNDVTGCGVYPMVAQNRSTHIPRGCPMRPTIVFAALIAALCAGCASAAQNPSAAPVSATSLAPTTPKPATVPFDRSVNDVIDALNLQLPLMEPDGTRLPTNAVSTGVFGGRVAPNAAVYLQATDTLFSKVRAVTVRVTGASGKIATPAKLLSGVGSSVCGVSADAVAAFSTDVLPHLSSIDQ